MAVPRGRAGTLRAMRGARTVRHVDALDGLRGVAVLGVLAFHLASLDHEQGPLSAGWLGVDVFFTLSGFLITSLLLRELHQGGRIDLRAFWRRRIRRLQPAALVAIAVIVLTAVWWAPGGTGGSVRAQALSALGGVANWHQLWADRPYAAGANPSGFEHFWSLAVEEQFYLLWPLAIAGVGLALRRRPDRVRLAVFLLAAGGTAASWWLLSRYSLQRAYLGTDARVGAILLGAALAAVLPLGSSVGGRARRWAPAAAWLAIAVSAGLWVFGSWPPRFSLAVILPAQGLATVALLASFTASPACAPARLFAWRPLAVVGRVSYGVYLWHWPLFLLLTEERLDAPWLVTPVVRLGALAAATALSWWLVERPVRLGFAVPRTLVAWPVAACAVVVVAFVGVRAVGPAPAWSTADGSLVVPDVEIADTPRAPGAARHPQRVLVVGDSIATSVISGRTETLQASVGHLFDHLAVRGIRGAGATITGCPVIDHVFVADGQVNRSCVEILQRRVPAAMDAFRPDLVVWYSRQEAYPFLDDEGRASTDQAELERRYADRIDWFAARGARVLLVSPGPNGDGYEWNVPEGRRDPMAELDRTLTNVAAAHPDTVVGVVRMKDVLCGGAATGCPDRDPSTGATFRSDGVHFFGPAEERASAWLAARIAEVELPVT
jgi:peptidoglycan/LPS O-acetylase OafA/YrhL